MNLRRKRKPRQFGKMVVASVRGSGKLGLKIAVVGGVEEVGSESVEHKPHAAVGILISYISCKTIKI